MKAWNRFIEAYMTCACGLSSGLLISGIINELSHISIYTFVAIFLPVAVISSIIFYSCLPKPRVS